MISAVPAPRLFAYASAAILAASLAYGLLHMPLQFHDALDEMMAAQRSPSLRASFTSTFGETSYFRLLRITETKFFFDVSGGHYFASYKAFHIAVVAAAFVLLTGYLRVATGIDLAAALFALAVFTGLHTLVPIVKEAYPVNHYLQIMVFSLAAAHVARSRGGWWIDAAAIVMYIAGSLLLESGVLIWVVIAASRLLGRRGVSDRAIALMTLLLAGYLFVRFVWLLPNLRAMGNASGYFFERLEVAQIRERFGPGLTRFNVYNVLASIASVLFSEPRAGVFLFAKAWSMGDVPPRMWISIASSAITTALIGVAVWRRWVNRTMDDGSTDLALFMAVLCANAVASYAYTKDDIISVAGAFYAVAAFWAVRDLLSRPHRVVASVVLGAALLIAGSGWSIRTVGVNYLLRTQAFAIRNDWAWVPDEMQRHGTWPTEPSTQRFVIGLRDSALAMPVVNPWFVPRWMDRVFDVDYF